jgi:dihydrolipoamide dehydrogenase
MPSKALLRPVAAVSELDVSGVFERRDEFAHHWKDDAQVEWLKNAGADFFRGVGRISGERVVKVADTELRARQAVVVAVGTRAVVPSALAGVEPWTSREATSAHEVPESLAIVGGGVVGCEMAAAWSALGARVTLLPRGGLLERLPGFAGDLVAKGLAESGVDVRLGVGVTGATRNGPVTLTLDDGTTLEAAEVLAAAGRAPRTDDIGLESVGLTPGSWLDVDDTMRVTAVDGGWLYASGDVNHLALLTHMGKYQGRICGDAIAARATGNEPTVRDRSSKTCIPQVIFTLPEVAAVGLTREQAESAGHTVRVVEYEIGDVAGASLFADDYEGRAQMIVDEETKTILGMTLAGPGVGEMIHAATIAVAGQVPLDVLWHAVPSYPTMSELWLRLLETYGL